MARDDVGTSAVGDGLNDGGGDNNISGGGYNNGSVVGLGRGTSNESSSRDSRELHSKNNECRVVRTPRGLVRKEKKKSNETTRALYIYVSHLFFQD